MKKVTLTAGSVVVGILLGRVVFSTIESRHPEPPPVPVVQAEPSVMATTTVTGDKPETSSTAGEPIGLERPTTEAITKGSVMAITNYYRVVDGLWVLQEDPTLSQVAEERAHSMEDVGYFSHYRPGENTYAFVELLREEGYPSDFYAGENLARNFTTLSAMMQAWLDSPTHRQNVYSPHYTKMGVGIAGSIVVVIYGQ